MLLYQDRKWGRTLGAVKQLEHVPSASSRNSSMLSLISWSGFPKRLIHTATTCLSLSRKEAIHQKGTFASGIFDVVNEVLCVPFVITSLFGSLYHSHGVISFLR